MFLTYHGSDRIGIFVNPMDSTDYMLIKPSPTGEVNQYHGTVGLAWERLVYRSAYRRWVNDANSWPCGKQDYFGDLLDYMEDGLHEHGFNHKIDRDQIMAHYRGRTS